MFCARCGAEAGARAVVCRSCGADLTRAGALRMTAGGIAENAADLDLPEALVHRMRADELQRWAASQPTVLQPAVSDPEPEPAPEPAEPAPTVEGSTTLREALAAVAASPAERGRRRTIIATALMVVLVVATMFLVNLLAQRLMEPLTPVPGQPTSAAPSSSAPQTPGATPSR
ncbi:hypothetical protein ACQB6R_12640 [Propionibacteriaceae bacterium G1746]|uniref:hypothetical protein n=1 Tax=Aestuariimicrobium sp. G57 TaxID=3418485 RepID=UPI003C1F833F